MFRRCPRWTPGHSAMVGSNKAATVRRRGLLGLSLLALFLTVGAGVLLWQAVELSSLAQVSGQVERLKPVASVVRLALIGLVGTLWPRLVDLGYRYGRVDETERHGLLAQRWRVMGWFLVIEFMLGQNLIGQFFTVTTGPVV